ncbi:MAG: hypothetical protein H6863_06440 [Rhodospirillales bacterium]|nr:hypothetical protein [Rhodospirillales bacterium]MCB9994872.1 hypothetical protein [Rhodospirillales bacterium]
MAGYQRFDPGNAPLETLAGLATLADPPPEKRKSEKLPAHNPYQEKWFFLRRTIMQKRGLDESAAGCEAGRWMLVDYMNEHPVHQPDPKRCIYCGHPYHVGGRNSGLPVLNGQGGHIWVHSNCHEPWMKTLEEQVRRFLEAQGIAF